MKQKKTKRKEKKNIPVGKAYIQATYNNTIVTLTDMQGNVIAWATAGGEGFKGSRKSTPFAAQMAAKSAAESAIDIAGLQSVEVYVKGPGIGREAAVRSLFQSGLTITKIKDVTPVPHNGCRPKKRRKV
ncbi:MAG TPA: 30S ribosomal protein S11 [Spirochaetota bacterium]|nr:MAG: 30S ribosomal protein S11 [Spirochaetes bacterium ADurb.Bin218]HOK02232.1 30S ribosomal protein S11 [Spirochaetota bacterium]HOK93179.1 30S ribosomal protein S11 [Spirochaetota bacterium]HON17251.1 30S ribosomal protein S11 [Spirochaetota bacterium]HOQ10758.1 30S ribosomal protein S11 [Spirochaetota bacterium]